ncbi:MAG TPA: alpha/beta fold hydrolase [Brevefilum sp.]|nr:alpha/beta fold hydrolase [Brevefilum sp.]HOR20080.1 alpha/beta fold hydrolase [Brevefilum sp.]HPL70143.1 alpha/beta fold hydrolase [Brevefilum sp.]
MMKINVNDVMLGFDLSGRNSPPLLLLHGFGLNRSIWRDLVENHLGNHQVIMPDLRGHGESDAPPGPYAMALLARDIAVLLETLYVDRAIVCGHSMGGYVALAFAEQFPEKLVGLGLVTTNAVADTPEKRAGRHALIDEIRACGSFAVADNLAPRLSTNLDVINKAHTMIRRCDPIGLIGSLQGMADRADKTALLQKIRVPALVVAGEEDQITDYQESQVLAESLPEGAFYGIPQVGHMPMLENSAGLGQGIGELVECVKAFNFD